MTTKATLDALAAAITRTIDNGRAYTAGQHFGLTWTLARDDRHALLHAKTKTELAELMQAMLAGLREAGVKGNEPPMPKREELSASDENALPLIWEMNGHKGLREYCRKENLSFWAAYRYLQQQGA